MEYELEMGQSDRTTEYYEFLDELRESAVTNMMGAGRYLEEEFGLGRYEARDILRAWMEQFGKE